MKDYKFETFTDFFNEAVMMKKIPKTQLNNPNAELELKTKFASFLKDKKKVSEKITGKSIVKHLTSSNFIKLFEYLENLKDPRYFITIDISKKADFFTLRNHCLEHGFFHITNTGVKIYNPYLAFILLHKELPVKNLETENELLLNCFVYSETFEKAYNEGVKYFKENFSANTNTLYGTNADAYTNNILEHYLTKENNFNGSSIKGWKGIETYYPEIITHKVIYKAGYYMGILSEAKELFKNHSKVFEKYFTNSEPTPTDEGKQPQHDVTNHFCKSMPLSVPREHFKVLTTTNSKNGKPFLTDEQFEKFIQRAFCGNNKMPKQKINFNKGEKLKLQALFYDFYELYCFEYFSTIKCQKQFVELLTENFEGWNYKNVKGNFKPKTKIRLQ